MEEFQQRINAVSLEKVKAYYRRLRYTRTLSGGESMPRRDRFAERLKQAYSIKCAFIHLV